MRINETLGMRVQDVQFDQHRIIAHGKGNKVRYVPLPVRLAGAISRLLRVKDLDFDHGILFVRCGKGDKDRSTLLPASL